MEKKKINILHVRSSLGPGGGPEKTILFSSKVIDRKKFNLYIVYLKSKNDPHFDLAERAESLAVKDFMTIDETYKFDIGALRKLYRILKKYEIDIIHCHCYKSDFYGLILSLFYKMIKVTTAHGPLATFQFFWASQNWKVRYIYDQLDLKLLRFFDKILIVSDTMREMIIKYGTPDEKLVWVKNAIDSSYFKKGEPNLNYKESLSIPIDATVIGAVGRLNGEKDYPNFIQAAKLLLEKKPDLYFTITGHGSIEQQLKSQVDDMGLSDRIIFLGHCQDVRKIYDIIDVYVLSSTREGLPNTVLEAMAMETPIVATNVDGVLEAVSHNKEAILVPPRNSPKLAEAIQQLLEDNALSKRLVNSAREKVEKEFSFETRIRIVEKIYTKLMKI